MKTCRDCKEEKPKNQFIRNGSFKDGYDTLCISCNRKRVKEWRKKNPEKRALQQQKEGKQDYSRSKHYRALYGITVEIYNEMFTNQKGCCAICNRHQSEFNKRFAVDHNHTTKQVRALLCHNCNALLGHSKESLDILDKAKDYLKKYTGY